MLRDGLIGERLKMSEYLPQLPARIVEHGVPRALNESDARRGSARARRRLRKSPLTIKQRKCDDHRGGAERPPRTMNGRAKPLLSFRRWTVRLGGSLALPCASPQSSRHASGDQHDDKTERIAARQIGNLDQSRELG